MTTTTKPIPSRRTRRVSALSEAIATHAPAVLLTLTPSEASGPASVSWIMIARQGTFRGHSAGEFTLDAESFAEMRRNHDDVDGGRVPVDFEHASEQPATEGSIPMLGAPAQGWVIALEVRGDGCLWGKVEWGAQARDYIREGKYKYVSPAVRFGSKHPTTGKPIGARLSSVALTNQPFLGRGDTPGSAGLAPITAKDTPPAKRAARPAPSQREDDRSDALRAEVERLRSALAAASKEAKRERKRRRQAEQRIADLECAATNREAREIEMHVDNAIATHRLTADRGALIAMCRADRQSFDRVYLPVPPQQRFLMTSIATGPHNVPTAAIPDEGDAPAKPVDVEAEATAMIEQAKKRGVVLSRDEAFHVIVGRIQREQRQGAPPQR